ncbi:MAG: hypothetical protein QOF84_2024 [Streptomyces sp.]|nr:hypothetical protein [Streptomyces sp.]
MYAGWRKARAIALATGVAAALTAGAAMTPAGAAPAQTAAGVEAAAKQAKATWVTLITGDRVAVSGKGKVLGVQRAAGRQDVPISVRKLNGHTYVIPEDAAKLISTGKVDKRLFDVTTLSRAEYRKAQAKSLGYIVTYKGSKPAAKAELHAADGTEVTHTYGKLNGEAVTTPKQDTAGVWSALTNEPKGSSPYATAESGLKTVWLDAVQKAAATDVSTNMQQINAPTAWSAGYDGTGVKIAILDTGIRKTHADLAGQVVDEKNFSAANNVDDHFGHGTHVASIAAGTGVKSSGKYKGVAYGAKLLNGKVLDDTGYGEDSGILAGLEWAAESGAKIANLSLGGTDTPGTDVLEEAVNTLSAQYGTLFVIAAGNEGDLGESTVGSPGSADAALTVGAVDSSDALASFSSRGPRVGDGAIKPDVTAPGVDITAAAASGSVIDKEVGENPAGYLTISGTSMATPHVAGAAALLAQEHPTWTGQQIKAALTASTVAGSYTPFQQGTGRIDLTKAISQTVTADPSSVNFGTALWPHADDQKLTKTVTYTNSGSADVTLDLTVSGLDPKGGAAPDGFFTLGANQVTVPAGGTATVDVSADTTLGGDVNGAYSAYVVGTASDGQTVRTAAAVTREAESYTLTLKHLDHSGNAASSYLTTVAGLDDANIDVYETAYEADGTVDVRLPKGNYALDSVIDQLSGSSVTGEDFIVHPKVSLTKDTTLTLDATKSKAVKISVPDSSAKQVGGTLTYDYFTEQSGTYNSWLLTSFKNVRTLHDGAAQSADAFGASVTSTWKDGNKEYNTSASRTKSFYTGYTHAAKASEFAKITTKAGSIKANTYGTILTFDDAGNGGPATITVRKLPYTATIYVTAKTAKWGQLFAQAKPDLTLQSLYSVDNKTYTAGKSYSRTFNVGPFGPVVNTDNGIYRTGDVLFANVGLFTDGAGHQGQSLYDSATTTLYRNGTKLQSYNGSLDEVAFDVPKASADYKLTTTVSRSSVASVSSKVVSTWTFTSKHVAEGDYVKLPASSVKFSPSLSTSNTSKAKTSVKVPVKVQGSAAGSNLKSLKVYVSFDGGKKWTKLTVTSGKVTVKNPKAGKGVSLKANVTDKKGRTLSEVLYNAYLTK